MAEQPETNRTNRLASGVTGIAPKPITGLMTRIDADALLDRMLASEHENSVPEEVIGTLVAVDDEEITIETRHRFEIPGEAPALLRRALGKLVGVVVTDGQVRWRLMEAAPEPGKGEPP